ncbi:MAG: hypothetical protein DI598_11285 [Pseudopedobacter saltans]|uniref:Uncharacterized protein n=1 Tax=Pseudopedobacter saltans TaxID=151895 RepID=A0A2W5F011_9SPHI|nr:MAG: hypothetical protein DI598_11285 [Pseudopedobacter saltans]
MKTIRFRYRKIIDASAKDTWDKMVWEDSFMEFKMQFQLFDQEGKYSSFGTLLRENSKAEQLHFLVGGSVMGYIEQLNGMMPDIVDNAGLRFMPIQECRFEIINSDRRNIERHQVAFNFYSSNMIWHETIGEKLLISSLSPDNEIYKTHLLSIRPYVTIDHIQYD